MKKELQSKDFRTGNFVYTTIDMGVYTMDAFIIKCLYYDGNIQNSHNTDKKLIEPIPIDKKWLLNFGFSIEHSRLTNIDKYFLPNTPFGYSQGSFSVITQTGCFSVKIEYVHELQNLYFALTREELELKNVTP